MIEVYRGSDGLWRFRITRENGEMLLGSGAYTRQALAVRAMLEVFDIVRDEDAEMTYPDGIQK